MNNLEEQCMWASLGNGVDFKVGEDKMVDGVRGNPSYDVNIIECSNPECEYAIEGPCGYICSIYTPIEAVDIFKTKLGYK